MKVLNENQVFFGRIASPSIVNGQTGNSFCIIRKSTGAVILIEYLDTIVMLDYDRLMAYEIVVLNIKQCPGQSIDYELCRLIGKMCRKFDDSIYFVPSHVVGERNKVTESSNKLLYPEIQQYIMENITKFVI